MNKAFDLQTNDIENQVGIDWQSRCNHRNGRPLDVSPRPRVFGRTLYTSQLNEYLVWAQSQKKKDTNRYNVKRTRNATMKNITLYTTI
jgi:hypothetical protein